MRGLYPQYRLYPLVKAVPQLSYRVCFFHSKHLLKHDLVDDTLTMRELMLMKGGRGGDFHYPVNNFQ
jgi:hypothetical protein